MVSQLYCRKSRFKTPLRFKNAPTCYRAPRWPDPEFPRKIQKKYPSGRNSGTPRKYPKNTEKIPKVRILGTLGVFFWYFRGILGVNSGSPEFRAGGYFLEIPGRAISGLCSRSGRSQTKVSLRFHFCVNGTLDCAATVLCLSHYTCALDFARSFLPSLDTCIISMWKDSIGFRSSGGSPSEGHNPPPPLSWCCFAPPSV